MPQKYKRSDNIFAYILFLAVLITVILTVYWFWPENKGVNVPKAPGEERAATRQKKIAKPSPPAPPEKTIKFEEAPKKSETHDTVEARKKSFGLDKSVDLIVTEGESVKIGDETFPMREILDKIRMKEGGFLETDLTDEKKPKELPVEKLKKYEEKVEELEEKLESLPPEKRDESYEKEARKLADLRKIVNVYDDYKEAVEDIEEGESLLGKENEEIKEKIKEEIKILEERQKGIERVLGSAPEPKESEKRSYERLREKIRDKKELLGDGPSVKEKIKKKIDALRAQRNRLKEILETEFLRDKEVNFYGIYVVQPGDNVWNIHFQFLTEYFDKRGVEIRSRDDEPRNNGLSSGVGRILKFSENMVYIYNIKEKKLSVDLHLIHPLSKIVIFNMGRAFSMLSRIDYESLDEVQYDGERLWIPAQQTD